MGDVRIHPWRISRTGAVDDFAESIFYTGNGYLGARGFAGYLPKRHPQEHAIFKAGFFSHITPAITDMVQLPDVLTLMPSDSAPAQVHQSLDLKTGVLTQAWETEQFRFSLRRMVSMAHTSLMAVRLEAEALMSADLNVQAVQDTSVANLPVHDDQTQDAKDLVQLLRLEQLTETSMRFHTVCEHEPLHIRWQIISDLPARQTHAVNGERAQTTLSRRMEQGTSWRIEKRILLCTGNEEAVFPQDEDDPWAANELAWAQRWADCDMEIDADDPEMQGAVRYAIFQLLANNAQGNPDVSIGARGLTHGRYKGNTFWDTDIFLLPFYLWTMPQAAKALMLYRARRLKDAQALAARQNLKGARFPWMCAKDGSEQSESWDIGYCETHITADVAYAMERYCAITGDDAFLQQAAIPVYQETARYWMSRLTWEPEKQQYSSFFVKGPDEYCGATVNNTYTNAMARHNLHLAIATAAPDAEETRRWQHAAEHIAILYDSKRKLYLQDELFERLEIPDFEVHSEIPSYKTICFDRMQRYRVLKQADLVLLCTLLPDMFTQEEKENIFRYYEPLTVHDSSLSWGTHAQLALQLGLWDKADEYLPKALYLDLKDRMGSTGREGLHMAALGALWQAMVYGAAGLWTDANGITLHPMLPASIHRIRFPVQYRGERYRIDVSHRHALAEKEG